MGMCEDSHLNYFFLNDIETQNFLELHMVFLQCSAERIDRVVYDIEEKDVPVSLLSTGENRNLPAIFVLQLLQNTHGLYIFGQVLETCDFHCSK